MRIQIQEEVRIRTEESRLEGGHTRGRRRGERDKDWGQGIKAGEGGERKRRNKGWRAGAGPADEHTDIPSVGLHVRARVCARAWKAADARAYERETGRANEGGREGGMEGRRKGRREGRREGRSEGEGEGQRESALCVGVDCVCVLCEGVGVSARAQACLRPCRGMRVRERMHACARARVCACVLVFLCAFLRARCAQARAVGVGGGSGRSGLHNYSRRPPGTTCRNALAETFRIFHHARR